MVAQVKASVPQVDFSKGVALVDGKMVPVAEARMPITDWGFLRSDVTYDVVHVWKGSFFRLDDHIKRFQASMKGLRLTMPYDAAGLKRELTALVRATGLRDAYVSMICTRGTLQPGLPRHPKNCINRFYSYVLPFVWVMPEDMQARGAHAIMAKTPRIPPESVDPTIKNFHWGDLTRAMFEASDAGADIAFLTDGHGHLTEGPGFNIFAIIDGMVISPDRGALEGITRKSVFELCDELGVPYRIRPLHVSELEAADELLTATTAGGVMPVSRLDGRIYSNDRPGPISAKLRQRYWQKHEEGWHATPIQYD
ncbi:MAG: aminotransferase class IV [Alphaproteobacteria bacterium]|nr:aminotransferase class IV [Alphaproteobacteria bacterium]